jgi:Zn-dependent protease/CBS domain-containing protein
MKWSFKIFSAFGIGVYIHATFLLLLLWIMLAASNLEEGITRAALWSTVFACVLLHEFGHALTAKRFGIRTRDITLLPIGGLARLEKIPSDPRQELLIALAGPAVNLAIAAIGFLIGLITGWGSRFVLIPTGNSLPEMNFLGFLLMINLQLALFNFIPAFPMDGGRVLRALLALKLDYLHATRIAVSVGQALAFAFGLFGLLNGNFMLLLIAFFVYLGAAQEGALAQYRQSFHGLPTSCAMITNFNVLSDTDRLEKAVEYLLLGSQVDFPVMRDHQVLGILTRGTLIDSLGKQGPTVTLANVPVKPVEVIDEDMPLDLAYETLRAQEVPCLPVMRGGDLVGLITLENMAEFAMVQSVLRTRMAAARAKAV